jgi:malate dehydrogenase (oxaloacetate-decarboxylating)(NADP+)
MQGLRQQRLRGAAYNAVLDAFMGALRQWRPHVLVQFEDFGNHTAFDLLRRYRASACVFNDDIQGTACITLAGALSHTSLLHAGREFPSSIMCWAQ